MKKEKDIKESFESLLNESLANAKTDRQLALEAYNNVKSIFENVDTTNVNSMQAILLVGQNVVKLLEQSSRSNEQIIRLAQLKEKEESTTKKKDDDEGLNLTMEDLIKAKNGS